jgi:hypothetical protein
MRWKRGVEVPRQSIGQGGQILTGVELPTLPRSAGNARAKITESNSRMACVQPVSADRNVCEPRMGCSAARRADGPFVHENSGGFAAAEHDIVIDRTILKLR